MSRKSGLGKGLDALIPTSEYSDSSASIREIPLDRIIPNPRQPRTNINDHNIAELAASIKEHGIIQPLIATHDPVTDQYTLIAGERRLQAAKQANLSTVPVVLRHTDDQGRLEIALVENIQRKDLTPIETAEAFRQLNEDFGLSHSEVAEKVGKSRVSVTNTLRLLNLPPKLMQALVDSKISEGHARALLALTTTQAQSSALNTILLKKLSVRQTEELIRRMSGERPPVKQKTVPSPEVKNLEARLRSRLGTKVRLKHGRKGGTITIHYYSEEELNTLLDYLMGEN